MIYTNLINYFISTIKLNLKVFVVLRRDKFQLLIEEIFGINSLNIF